MNDNMQIEGEPMKPFALWRVDSNGRQLERVAEADTLEELEKVGRRADWRYKIYKHRKPI